VASKTPLIILLSRFFSPSSNRIELRSHKESKLKLTNPDHLAVFVLTRLQTLLVTFEPGTLAPTHFGAESRCSARQSVFEVGHALVGANHVEFNAMRLTDIVNRN
jgi:hypothetical protein